MRLIIMTLFGLAVFAAQPAASQTNERFGPYRVHPSERYCMDMEVDSATTMVCQFNTLEQCRAARTHPGLGCYLNPFLAWNQREDPRGRR